MTCLTNLLRRTVTAQWYASYLRSGRAGRRGQYIRTAVELLRVAPEQKIDRAALVQAAGGRSNSTMYQLFGPSAADALLNQGHGGLRAIQEASDVVAGLVVETKVCSHWPYREGWLEALLETGDEDRAFAAETLVRVLATWAAGHRAVAATLDGAPPVSAVEDLTVICHGPVPVERVRDLLREVIGLAADPACLSPRAILGMVRRDLMDLVLGGPPPVEQVVASLIADVAEIGPRFEYHMSRLDTDQQRRLANAMRTHLFTALQKIGDGSRG